MTFDLKNQKQFKVPESEFTFIREKILEQWNILKADIDDLAPIDILPAGSEIYSSKDSEGQIHIILRIPGDSQEHKLNIQSAIELSHHFLTLQSSDGTVYCGAISQEEVNPHHLVYDFHHAIKKKIISIKDKKFQLNIENLEVGKIYHLSEFDTQYLYAKNKKGEIFKVKYSRRLKNPVDIFFYSFSSTENRFTLIKTKTVAYKDRDATIYQYFYENEFPPLEERKPLHAFLTDPTIKAKPQLIMQNVDISCDISSLSAEDKQAIGLNCYDLLSNTEGTCHVLIDDFEMTVNDYIFSNIYFENPSKDHNGENDCIYIYIDEDSKKLCYRIPHEEQSYEVNLESFNSEEKVQISTFSIICQKEKEAIAQKVLKQIKQKQYNGKRFSSPDKLLERLELAEKCCHTVSKFHKKELLVVDIHPNNFTCEEGKLINISGVISRQDITSNRIRQIPPVPFCAPEWVETQRIIPTLESDIFALGQTLDRIFFLDEDVVISSLCKAMTFSTAQHRISLNATLAILTSYISAIKNSTPIVKFITISLQSFIDSLNQELLGRSKKSAEKNFQQKIESLAKILQVMSEEPRFNHDYLAQQTVIELIDKMPNYTDWINNICLKSNLCDAESVPWKCSILDSIAYLQTNSHIQSAGRNRVKLLIKKASQKNRANQPLETLLSEALKGSSNRENSRNNVIRKESPESKLESPFRTTIIYKVANLLQKNPIELKEIAKHPNFEKIVDILSIAFEYLHKTKNSYFHFKGRSAVTTFIKTLCTKEFLNADNLNQHITDKKDIMVYGAHQVRLFKTKTTKLNDLPKTTLRAKTFIHSH